MPHIIAPWNDDFAGYLDSPPNPDYTKHCSTFCQARDKIKEFYNIQENDAGFVLQKFYLKIQEKNGPENKMKPISLIAVEKIDNHWKFWYYWDGGDYDHTIEFEV